MAKSEAFGAEFLDSVEQGLHGCGQNYFGEQGDMWPDDSLRVRKLLLMDPKG